LYNTRDIQEAALGILWSDIPRRLRGEPTTRGPVLMINRRTTRSMLSHELIHLEDLVITPLPELARLDEMVTPPRSLRARLRNWAIQTSLIGRLEERAHLLGDRAYDLATGRLTADQVSTVDEYYRGHQRQRARADLWLNLTWTGWRDYRRTIDSLKRNADQTPGASE
jgi:hypothetical protein